MEPQPGVAYPLVLGSTLAGTKRKADEYCCLRYDFLPASAARAGQGHLEVQADSQALVHLPSSAPGAPPLLFAGRHEHSRDGLDCVAIFDGTQFRLEVLSASVKSLRQRAVRNGPVPRVFAAAPAAAAEPALGGAASPPAPDADDGGSPTAAAAAEEAAGAEEEGAAREGEHDEDLDLEKELFDHLTSEMEGDGEEEECCEEAAAPAPPAQQQPPQQHAAAAVAEPATAAGASAPDEASSSSDDEASEGAAAGGSGGEGGAAAPQGKAAAPAPAAAAPAVPLQNVGPLSDLDLEFFGVGSPEPPGDAESSSSEDDEEGDSSGDEAGPAVAVHGKGEKEEEFI